MDGVVAPSTSFNLSFKDSPNMNEFLRDSYHQMNHFFIFMLITFICTLVTIAISIVHMLFIAKYVSMRRLRNNLYYVVALNPVSALCCFFAMIMPRNLAFLQGVILTYQMMSLRISIDVLFNISGGMRLLSNQLKASKENIKLKAFPFCCCHCLPEVKPSVRNIRKLENIISQTCVIRIVLQVADICIMMETDQTASWWFVCSYFVSFITMLTALYVSCVIVNLNRDMGNKFRYNYLFYMVNISQILYTLQRTIFSAVSYFIKTRNSSDFLQSIVEYDYFEETYYLVFAFSVEVALMSIVISIIMRPGVTYIFDSYSTRADSEYKPFLTIENSGRGDKESKENVEEDPKRPIGPDTVTKTLGRDSTEPKKAKIPGAVEDDGNYENLNPANEQDLKKVLKNMEKKG